jgi:hypothetical protein
VGSSVESCSGIGFSLLLWNAGQYELFLQAERLVSVQKCCAIKPHSPFRLRKCMYFYMCVLGLVYIVLIKFRRNLVVRLDYFVRRSLLYAKVIVRTEFSNSACRCLTFLHPYAFVTSRPVTVFILPAGHHRPLHQIRRRRWFWFWHLSLPNYSHMFGPTLNCSSRLKRRRQ